MSKKSRDRKNKHVFSRLVKSSIYFDTIRRYAHQNWTSLGGSREWVYILSILQTKYVSDVICVRSYSTLEIQQDRGKRANGMLMTDALNELVADAQMKPPYDYMFFEFKPIGPLHETGAFVSYFAGSNSFAVQGIKRIGDGRILVDGITSEIFLDDHYNIRDYKIRGDENELEESVAEMTLIDVVISIGLINCRNIELIDHEPDPATSREYENHFGQPLTKYKTLAIKQMGKRYESGEPQPHQDLMPLHLRRGNFATYTDDAPLFGKYTGTFWRPATVVGNEKNGIVVKDYKIEPPEDKAS